MVWIGHGADVVVVENVRTKKQHRRYQRSEHRQFMTLALAAADGHIAEDEKDCAEGVEAGIDIR